MDALIKMTNTFPNSYDINIWSYIVKKAQNFRKKALVN